MEAVRAALSGAIELDMPLLWLSALWIVATPTWWNVTARLEYRTHFLTRLCCGHRYVAAYALAFAIFMVSNVRSYLFHLAVEAQPHFVVHGAAATMLDALGYALMGVGAVLVAASYYRLGIVGTYLGDYFGILMKERVTGFPYNVTDDPMYNGGTLIYLSDALLLRSYAGLALTLVVFVTYRIATHYFEGPFTAYIYQQAAAQASKSKRQ